VRLNAGDSFYDQLVPGDLRVRRPDVKIDSISPTTAYRDGFGRFSFMLVGHNLGSVTRTDAAAAPVSTTIVEIEGEGNIGALPLVASTPRGTPAEEEQQCADAQPTISRTSPLFKPCFWVDDAGDQLRVRGYRAKGDYQGPMNVRVRVGESHIPSGWSRIVLARASTTTVWVLALALFVLLGILIGWMVTSDKKDTLIHGRRYGPLYAFLIDSQTNTYSLSKFQLFAFSFTFIFSYLYVTLCQWLIQWKLVLPDIPSNLAALLGISGGATLAAAAATQTRGTKGAGDIYPSFSDFVTTGGLVVPERFQFLVWTLIACVGFLALLVAKDPATIDGFPAIPDGVLYVMGVSTVAYVGGKVTRQAGPVIKAVAFDADHGNPVIVLQGENLSTDADFLLDGAKLPIVAEADKVAANLAKDQPLVVAKPQANASDRSFSSELRIILVSTKVTLAKGPHRFKIVNKDGQFAEAEFPQPVITAVTPKAGSAAIAPNANVTLTVTGTNFFQPVAATWTPAVPATPAAPVAPAPTVTVARTSETQVEVTVTNVGPAGTATLTIGALGGEASTTVKI
jgi:hypothetical protein